jgi:DNA modification methylase
MQHVHHLIGDCRETLRTLPDNHFHCVVTSPPYWNLRSYLPKDHPDKAKEIGLKPLPVYLEELVQVFREVRRVLREDGVCWINMGDSYTSGNRKDRDPGDSRLHQAFNEDWETDLRQPTPAGLKNKELVGVPWRLAFALQADGWYLRMDCIWHKPNPMPESVQDRCTKAHEYLFMLTKSERYFYDKIAIEEKVNPNTHARCAQPNFENQAVKGVNPKAKAHPNAPRGWKMGPGDHRDLLGRYEQEPRVKQNADFSEAISDGLVSTRNKRSVWTIEDDSILLRWMSEQPEGEMLIRREMKNRGSVFTQTTFGFAEAHFATYPPDLIRPCILSSTSAMGCCPTCGAPWERVVEKGEPNLAQQRACGGDVNGEYHGTAQKEFDGTGAQNASAVKARILAGMKEKITVDWIPTCQCPKHRPQPCRVLDPFGGSGTTGMVAQEEGREATLCELYDKYAEISLRRANVPQLKLPGV